MISERFPNKCVLSNTHKQLSFLCLGEKDNLKSPRIVIPVDAIKMNENNNNSKSGKEKHKSFPEMWADIPKSAMAPALSTNSENPLALVQRLICSFNVALLSRKSLDPYIVWT